MLKAIAQFISVVFHPLLILTYSLIMLLCVNPYIFGVHSISGRMPLVIITFMTTFTIPALAVFMMKSTGLIESIQLKDRQERTVPYVVTCLFYTAMTVFTYKSPLVPPPYSIALLGSTIGLYLAFFLNIFQKISAHAVGIGGFLSLLMIVINKFSYDSFVLNTFFGSFSIEMTSLLIATILVAGLVGTARLLLDAHTTQELFGGYLVGFTSMIIAFRFVI